MCIKAEWCWGEAKDWPSVRARWLLCSLPGGWLGISPAPGAVLPPYWIPASLFYMMPCRTGDRKPHHPCREQSQVALWFCCHLTLCPHPKHVFKGPLKDLGTVLRTASLSHSDHCFPWSLGGWGVSLFSHLRVVLPRALLSPTHKQMCRAVLQGLQAMRR